MIKNQALSGSFEDMVPAIARPKQREPYDVSTRLTSLDQFEGTSFGHHKYYLLTLRRMYCHYLPHLFLISSTMNSLSVSISYQPFLRSCLNLFYSGSRPLSSPRSRSSSSCFQLRLKIISGKTRYAFKMRGSKIKARSITLP